VPALWLSGKISNSSKDTNSTQTDSPMELASFCLPHIADSNLAMFQGRKMCKCGKSGFYKVIFLDEMHLKAFFPVFRGYKF
jgi:hypothetical protein